MNLIQAILLGVVQGLTEFIPISSSGHLVILHEVLNVDVGLAFDVALHGGTLLALVVFFHKDIVRLAKALFIKSDETKLAWLLALATIPAVVAGILLESSAESTFRSTTLVAINLMIAGLIMFAAEWYAKHQKRRAQLNDITLKQALGVGLAQALAIVPGVSRSGSTITMGLFMGIDRVAATRFAFLLGIPIIAGAFIKTMLGDGLGEFQAQPDMFVVGALAAFLSGLVAIRFLLYYLSKHSLALFAWYRIALGVLILLAL